MEILFLSTLLPQPFITLRYMYLGYIWFGSVNTLDKTDSIGTKFNVVVKKLQRNPPKDYF